MSVASDQTFTIEFPRLRQDLEIREQDTPDGLFYQVHDPARGRFYRFRQLERALAIGCDGDRSAAELCGQVNRDLQLSLSLEAVETFVQQLEQLGLLESGNADAPPAARPAIQGSLLHLRVCLWNPDSVFQRLSRCLGFLFTSGFLGTSILFLLAAVYVAVIHREALGSDVARLAHPQYILPGIVAFAALAFCHESAHGLTCRYYGGQVRELGLLLIYFMPAFYCDVSGAWTLERKSHRMWVTLAGVWCNFLIWALAIFVWRATDSESWIHTAALLLITWSGVDTLLNLTPLIKLDGYYLLSDALDAPNLRGNSFAYLGQSIRQFAGGPARSLRPSVRLRGVYLSYGLAAALFSSGLLLLVAFKIGWFVMSRYQALGFLLLIGTLIVTGWRPLLLVLRSSVAFATAPFGQQGWIARLMLALATPATGLMFFPWGSSVVGEVEIESGQVVSIRPETDGLIAQCLVSEGDTVSAGQLVVRLANIERDAELRQLEAQLTEQSAKLELLKSGVRPEQIALASAAVETARRRRESARRTLAEAEAVASAQLQIAIAELEVNASRLELSRKVLQRREALLLKKASTVAEFEQCRSAVEIAEGDLRAAKARQKARDADHAAALAADLADAEAEVKEAELQLELLRAGPRDAEVAGCEAKIAELTAKRDVVLGMIARSSLHAPIGGVVTTPDLHQLRQKCVRAGDKLMTVQDFEDVRVQMSISERELGAVRVGQRVDLKVLAFPSITFTGKVLKVAPAATCSTRESTASRRFTVTSVVKNSNGQLRPGMTGRSKIRCGQTTIGTIALRKLWQSVAVEFWAWW